MADKESVPHCQAADVGIMFTDETPDHVHDSVTEYLHAFAAPLDVKEGLLMGGSACYCGQRLSGFLGTFTYGLAHGEGRCSQCGAPARADHYIKDRDGDELVALRGFPLLYHPDSLVAA